ncbi:MAG: hypothetical protein E6K93_05360 [Thaumarchaeota archaeon]|nr:MAG: hypothetical protein E6K93_05360 [Nitrososphaerota archaeon]
MKNFAIMTLMILIVIPCMLPAAHSEISDKTLAKLQNGVWQAKAGKQMQVVAEVTNGQDRAQPFAYIVQIQNKDGVVVSLSWLTGTLNAGQSLSPAQSWIPISPGAYTAQIFVWAGIDNPDALSPALSMEIEVT